MDKSIRKPPPLLPTRVSDERKHQRTRDLACLKYVHMLLHDSEWWQVRNFISV